MFLAAPGSIAVGWKFGNRELKRWARCYLRVGLGQFDLDRLRWAMNGALAAEGYEPSSVLAPPGCVVQWAHKTNTIRIILWATAAAGDPLIEIRSWGDAHAVVKLKSTLIELLYFSDAISAVLVPSLPRPIHGTTMARGTS